MKTGTKPALHFALLDWSRDDTDRPYILGLRTKKPCGLVFLLVKAWQFGCSLNNRHVNEHHLASLTYSKSIQHNYLRLLQSTSESKRLVILPFLLHFCYWYHLRPECVSFGCCTCLWSSWYAFCLSSHPMYVLWESSSCTMPHFSRNSRYSTDVL